MRVITEPTVTLVSITQFIPHPHYKLPPCDNQLVSLGAFSAKLCYDSFGETGRSCEENQGAILEHRHGSVLEHLNAGLFIEGVTRGLTLELNRHRTFAISQRSTRYTREEDAAIVLDPYYAKLFAERVAGHDPELGVLYRSTETAQESLELELLHEHLYACQKAILSYEEQVKHLMDLNPNDLTGFDLRKWARGKARNLLPHALETRGLWTTNLRGWRWFLESRSDRHAEPEIRRLAGAVYDTLLVSDAGFYLTDYTIEMVDGLREFQTPYRKV